MVRTEIFRGTFLFLPSGKQDSSDSMSTVRVLNTRGVSEGSHSIQSYDLQRSDSQCFI